MTHEKAMAHAIQSATQLLQYSTRQAVPIVQLGALGGDSFTRKEALKNLHFRSWHRPLEGWLHAEICAAASPRRRLYVPEAKMHNVG